MLEYDGPLVRKNRELSEFVHDILHRWDNCRHNSFQMAGPFTIRSLLVEALHSRKVPYAHPIYGALEPKGSVADVPSKR